jgi:hypothetical protein
MEKIMKTPRVRAEQRHGLRIDWGPEAQETARSTYMHIERPHGPIT